MNRGRMAATAGVAAVLAASTYVYFQFRADHEAAEAALAAYETRMVEASFWPVEYVDVGAGVPVLSIHGTGGGFDQGLAIAATLGPADFRIIAPSRFGYLGTPVPETSDAAAQADAFAELLTALEIDRAVVIGASAGAITALHFAERHPDRSLALLAMVPAYYPGEETPSAPWSPVREWAMTTALKSDFLFWAGSRLMPDRFAATLLATDRTLIEGGAEAERARLDAVVRMIRPISDRAEGLLLDARHTAAPKAVDLKSIRVPTFIASAEDDHYDTAESARRLAREIPDAELLITSDGGHVWVNRTAEVEAAVAAFLDRVLSDAAQTPELPGN